jgi:HD-GYP domain-containing protein (c-di-GMP phosphodiesterase class II)
MRDVVEDGKSAAACVVYHGVGVEPDGADARWRSADEFFRSGGDMSSPPVLLVDASLLERIAGVRTILDHVVVVATDKLSEDALGDRADIVLDGLTDATATRIVVRTACRLSIERLAAKHASEEFQELSRIGIALMSEHDRKALLHLIVAQGKRLTHSDAAGLLLVRRDEKGRRWMRPVLYGFDSLDNVAKLKVRPYPVDETSIIGHAVLIKQPVVIADAYDLPRDADFEMNVVFDERHGYRRRSMLAVPMIDQLDRVMGVLLFINRKTDPTAKITSKEAADRYVVEYSAREVRLARSLASQAAVAIENTRLYAQIERTLESFVKASVSAIDLRDPSTAGHSLRVAALATGLAKALERGESGPYSDVHFTSKELRELRFAALLHDFGKVAVREDVLLKAKKLPPLLWERIEARFELIRTIMELESVRARAKAGPVGVAATLAAQREELERCYEVVRAANEPSVLDAPAAAELLEIARRTFTRSDGTIARYLTAEEMHFLQLPKGTLDDRERAEIESHVTKTFQFLSIIPWTDDLKNMVSYTYGHHEKLNGSGYPRHLKADEIPIQTRLIAVADMFDALTAADRPYKRAVTPDKALDILQSEAKEGRLDAELVRVMRESKLYRALSESDWRELL